MTAALTWTERQERQDARAAAFVVPPPPAPILTARERSRQNHPSGGGKR